MKYIYSTSQILKLSLTLHTFSVTGSVDGLFLTISRKHKELNLRSSYKFLKVEFNRDNSSNCFDAFSRRGFECP